MDENEGANVGAEQEDGVAETPESGEGQQPEAREGEEGESGEPKPREKRKDGINQRFSEFAREKRENQREIVRLREENERLKAAPADDGAPKIEDFDGDWAKWNRALAKYETTEALKAQANESKTAADHTAKAERLETALRQGESDYADFEAKIDGIADKMTSALTEAVLDTDDPSGVLYHLAAHPDKIRELKGLSPTKLGRALGRIEDEIGNSPRETKASTPPSRLHGGSSRFKSDDEMSTAEWMAKEDAREKALRSRK